MTIKDAVARASAYLTEHPDEARYRDSPAIARIHAGLAASVTGPIPCASWRQITCENRCSVSWRTSVRAASSSK